MPREGSKTGRNGKSSKTARVMNLLTDTEAVAENDTVPSGSARRNSSSHAASARRTINDENTQEQIRSALETELTGSAAPASRTKSAPKAEPAPKESVAEAEDVIFEEEQAQALPHEPAQNHLAEASEADFEEYDFEDVEEYDSEDSEEEDFEVSEEEDLEDIETEDPEDIETEDPEDVETEDPEDIETEDPEDVETEDPEDVETEDSEDVAAEDSEDTEDEDNVDDYICFNVTQALVEDKTEKYMKMFGMCTCNRCRIDVIALALSNLPAKYVVAKPKDMVPRLSMYESKYSAAVITQVMKACTKVAELPHHKR